MKLVRAGSGSPRACPPPAIPANPGSAPSGKCMGERMHAGERGARAGIKNPTLQLGNLSLRGFPACTSRSFHMWLEAYVCPHLPSPPPPSPTVHLSPRRLCHLLPSKCPPCSTFGLHTCCVICLKQMALAVSSACLPQGSA